MTLPDINVWIALAVSNHAHHDAAIRWFETQQLVGFCRVTQQGYLRLLSNGAMMKAFGVVPLTNAEAWATYEALLADDRITYLEEPTGLEPIWKRLGTRDTASTKLWMDAFLAAFAIAGDHELASFDEGFGQFADLRLHRIPP